MCIYIQMQRFGKAGRITLIAWLCIVLAQCGSQNLEELAKRGFDDKFGGCEKHSVIWDISTAFSEFPEYRFYYTRSADRELDTQCSEMMAVVSVDDISIRYIKYRSGAVGQLNYLFSSLTIDELIGKQNLTEQLCKIVQDVAVGSGNVIWTINRENQFLYIDENAKEVDVGLLHKPKVFSIGDGRVEIKFFSRCLNRLMRNSIIVGVSGKGIKVVSFSDEFICNVVEL